MFTASRLSKKTFFAAALGLAAVLPAQAYLFEDEIKFWVEDLLHPEISEANGYNVYRGGNSSLATTTWSGGVEGLGGTTWKTFVKTGGATLASSSLGIFGTLYECHRFGYIKNDKDSDDGAYYIQQRTDGVIQDGTEFKYGSADDITGFLNGWTSGEVVVAEGTLKLSGYINAWYDFGTVFNNEELGQNEGKILGVSRVTVRSGATLDISANNNFVEDGWDHRRMVHQNSYTTFQFLNNLQAGDLGVDLGSEVRLGTSTAYHVNINVGGWNENERINTGVQGAYFDSNLAFGGSIGRLSGNGNIYKTGSGAFAILGASGEFRGSLYAAGGELVLSGEDSVGSVKSFKDAFGNAVRVQLSESVGNAESVNLAGTRNSAKTENGGSMQGSKIVAQETYAEPYIETVNAQEKKDAVYTSVKESFFTTPDAGTLVIAENQKIKNLQAYFNAGLKVADGTSAHRAVLDASVSEGVLAPIGGAESGTADAPIIAGTGIGSTIVIPGGNYRIENGQYVQNTDKNGYMQGGVLVVNQEAGKGGIYEGAIVGARVSIYDKTTFETNTKGAQTTATIDNAERLNKVRVTSDTIKTDLKFSDEQIASLKIADDGSFALDNPLAWQVVEYYKQRTLGKQYYIDYTADAGVTGGLLVLEGAGDLALLLESANYSGIYIDENRTGKTVLNVSAVNSLEGSSVSLGGRGIVSFVATQGETMKVKLSGFKVGSTLVFATADTVNTVSGNILVGDGRQASIGFTQIQDDVYGDVYVEKGIGLNLTGKTSVFANADSVTLWQGKTKTDTAKAAPTLTLFNKGSEYANQVVNDLTGDATAIIDLGSGVLTTVVTDNSVDAYSGLTHGTYLGGVRGNGSLIKGGNATFTLGGGEQNRNLVGTTEIAAGTLAVTRDNSLTGTSALILNAKTSATMSGNQKLRTLYGSAETSLTVEGVLTLGANTTPASGENRVWITNNLGTSGASIKHDAGEASFARFENCFDLEGNLLDSDPNLVSKTQKTATALYLTTAARLAYSGFETGVLEKFVGIKNYDGTELLSEADYATLKAFAANGGTGTEINGVKQATLLADLGDLYEDLTEKEFYLTAFAPTTTEGWYSPTGLKSLFSSTREYNDYVKNTLKSEVEAKYGKDIPTNPTKTEKEAINKALFEVLCKKYEELAAADLSAQLKKNPTAMFARFKTAKNLAGTPLMSEEEIATLDETIKTGVESGDYSEIEIAYKKWSEAYETVQNKSQFAGISVPGAFAAQVDASGKLTDTSWIDEPSFAGTLTVGSLVKTGDNAVALTGTLKAESVAIENGTLEMDSDTLQGKVAGGIAVSNHAALSVNVDKIFDDKGEETEVVFDQTVSGEGNFIKAGDGKLTLGKDVLYTGTTEVRGGTLQMTLRESRTQTVDGVTKTLLPQSDITLYANTALILDQNDDVVWAGSITGKASNTGDMNVSLTKIGDAELTVGGTVKLGRAATIAVEAGTLNLKNVEFGVNTSVSVASEAALSIGSGDWYKSGGSVAFSGDGALRIAGDVKLKGATNANAEFTGAVMVQNGGTLTLSGSSVFENARQVAVNGGGKLVVEKDSTQKFTSLSGSGALELAGTLELSGSGERVAMDYSAGVYVFNDDILAEIPNFSGNVSGAGTLSVVGSGAASFSGSVSETQVSVAQGGQVVVNATKKEVAGTAEPIFKGKLSVDGTETNGRIAEAIFLVSEGSASINPDTISFSNGGALGKVGSGSLSVAAADLKDCTRVSVYEGELSASGWFSAEKYISSVAKLSMTLDGENPDFKTVYGSGILDLTANKNATITLSPNDVVITPNKDGKFFNGEIRFSGEGYTVNLGNGQMTSVGTAAGVTLNVTNGVTFMQARDSEIAGAFSVTGDVGVNGLSANSGNALSSDCKTLTISGDFSKNPTSNFTVKNVGLGFKSDEADIAVLIDKESTTNTFVVDLVADGETLVASGTKINLNTPLNAGDATSLKNLSVIKTGTGVFTLAGTAVADSGSANVDYDGVFGIGKDVYATLEKNGGVLNLGVNSGVMNFEVGAQAELTTANGVNVDLVSLRNAANGTVGTLVVSSSAPATRALDTSAQNFAETVRGGGNVEFNGLGSGLAVSAKQETLGQTTVSGNVEFSGAGRNHAASQLTVKSGATLHGGVVMTGRDVNYTVNTLRNADDSGAAGSATLTLTLNDARLASAMKYRVEVLANGTISSVTQLGDLPAGITVDTENVSYKDGVLTMSVTDSAFGGETYSVAVNTGTLPNAVGDGTSFAGISTVSGNVALASGSVVVLDAAAGDKIALGAGELTIENASIRVENLGTEMLGKQISLVQAGTVNDIAEGKEKTQQVVDALRKANKTRATGTEEMELMVYTDSETGEICAKMIIPADLALNSDYNESVSESFMLAVYGIAKGPGATNGIINADLYEDGKSKDLFFALNGVSASQLGNEITKLSPAAFSSMLAMPVAAFNSDIARIHSRLDQRRYDGADPLRETGEYEFFALAQSDFAENGSASDAPVYDYNLYGVTAGFDWKPNFETTLGLALGYTYGKAKVHNAGGKINMDDMRITAFASRLFGNCYIDAGVQAGMATFDVRRNTVAGTTSGDTDSVFAGTFITVGSVYSLWQNKKTGSGLYFTPSVGLSYLHTAIDGFSERGTAGLKMDDAEGDSLRARIAAAMQWEFLVDDWKVRLGAEVAYAHDFLGEELDMDGRFAAGSSKFSVSGKALPTDIFSFGPTVDIMVSERSSVYFGYGVDIDTDSGVSQNVNAGFRHRF